MVKWCSVLPDATWCEGFASHAVWSARLGTAMHAFSSACACCSMRSEHRVLSVTRGVLRAQVVTPSDGTSDNFARIVVNLRLKQAGTYSVRSTQALLARQAHPACL